MYGSGETQQDGSGKLVIQKTALDVSAFCHNRAWVHGDDVTGLDPKCQSILIGRDIFIQQDLHIFFDQLGLLINHVGRRFLVQYYTGVNSAITSVNGAVLPVRCRPLMTADGCGTQTSVFLDGTNHSSQCIHMGRQYQRRAGTTQSNEYIPLITALRGIPQRR